MTLNELLSFQPLPESHPVSRLFVVSPELKDVPEVRAFFDQMERWYGKAARSAAHQDFFPCDIALLNRGLMILSTLDTSVVDLYRAARTAIKANEAQLNDLDVATCSLCYGIYRATIAKR